jgi:hypothetical protein
MKKTYIAPYVETDVMDMEDMLATSIIDITGDTDVVRGNDEDGIPTEADIREDLIPLEW